LLAYPEADLTYYFYFQ